MQHLLQDVYVTNQMITDRYAVYNGDSVELIKGLPDESIDFIIFSPPFSTLYIYSDSYADMGNCKDDDEFFEHFEFLVRDLLRVIKPGRLCAVHCKNMPLYKTRDGVTGLKDFRGDLIRAFIGKDVPKLRQLKSILHLLSLPTQSVDLAIERLSVSPQDAQWVYHTEVVINTDPVFERARTNTQKLLYKQLRTDASLTGVGTAEYLVVFRKWTDTYRTSEPVEHYADVADFDRRKQGTQLDESMIFPLERWQRWAKPVWNDIRRMDVLNVNQARSEKDEKHICPLQLEVIRRAVKLWTNPGDIVLSPFHGIGSEGYVSLIENRRYIGFELKEEYFQDSLRYLHQAANQNMSLLDLIE